MEVTLEVSCCKYPRSNQLPQFWEDNREALLRYPFILVEIKQESFYLKKANHQSHWNKWYLKAMNITFLAISLQRGVSFRFEKRALFKAQARQWFFLWNWCETRCSIDRCSWDFRQIFGRSASRRQGHCDRRQRSARVRRQNPSGRPRVRLQDDVARRILAPPDARRLPADRRGRRLPAHHAVLQRQRRPTHHPQPQSVSRSGDLEPMNFYFAIIY